MRQYKLQLVVQPGQGEDKGLCDGCFFHTRGIMTCPLNDDSNRLVCTSKQHHPDPAIAGANHIWSLVLVQ